MVRIEGIKDFMCLREEQQSDILRGLKFKERLFSFLENRQSKEVKEKRQVDCKHCCGSGKILLEPRNNADIHASQIHLCPRKLWFDLKGYGNKYSQKPAPQLQLIFDHGTKLHDMLQEYGMQGAWKSADFTTYLPEARLLPTREECIEKGVDFYPLAAKFRIRSSIDAVIKNFVVEDVRGLGTVVIDVIQEIKSISSAGLAKLDGPKPVHKKQGTLYQAVTNIPICVYMYYGKDDGKGGEGNLKFYAQRFDGYVWAEVEDKINEVLLMEDEEDPDFAMPIERTAWTYDKAECVGTEYNSPCQYYGTVCKPSDTVEASLVTARRGRKKKNELPKD